MTRATSDQLDALEREHNLNIETSDATGNTHVYAYTEDGERLGFELYGMNPNINDVRDVAAALTTLRRICNARPRVGRLEIDR